MSDENRITVWLESSDKWLCSEKERIHRVAKFGEKCEIVSRTIKRKIKDTFVDVTQKTLFYTNGFYKDGTWVAAEEQCVVAA